MCFVWILEQTAIISLYNIHDLHTNRTGTLCTCVQTKFGILYSFMLVSIRF
jgi:hypothetical protein